MNTSNPGRNITDQGYLKNEQYRTDANLLARITLHRKYGTNPGSWFHWIFDHLQLSPGSIVLEVGCGPGDLWYENRDRLPDNLTLLMGDLSIGMVQAARRKNSATPAFHYLSLDAQHISLRGASVDCIVANHMLYHVPDMVAALAECRRVLKPGGLLCAATNGMAHMKELHQLVEKFKPSYTLPVVGARRFSLENGEALLSQVFSKVKKYIYEDNLLVTNAADLMAYIGSMWHVDNQLDQQEFERLRSYTIETIRTNGQFFIEKSQGIIMAST